jgi:hypothetical protein
LISKNILADRASFLALSALYHLGNLDDSHSNDIFLYFGDTYMTNVASNASAAKFQTAAETKQIVLA